MAKKSMNAFPGKPGNTVMAHNEMMKSMKKANAEHMAKLAKSSKKACKAC